MFAIVDAAMLRVTALRSINDWADWPEFDVLDSHQVEHWRGWLQKVWQEKPFVAAVEAASYSLAHHVDDILAGRIHGVRDVRTTVESVLRYLLRAQSRATPFGLFAGVSPVRFDTEATVRAADPTRTKTRIDAGWLADMIGALHQRPSVRDDLRVVRANTSFIRDGRLVLNLRRQLSDGTDPAEVSVRHTPLIELITSSTRRPILVCDVVSAVLQASPSTSVSDLAAVIDLLIKQQFLITNLHTHSTRTDPLDHVLTTLATTRVEGDSAAAPILRDLRRVQDHLNAGGSAAAGHFPPLSVDLHADLAVSIPHAVAHEAANAATVLTRLKAWRDGKPAWRDYHTRFVERYGVGAVVPLLHLVNPDVGLGFPAGYRGSLFEEPVTPPTNRDAVLLRLAQQATVEHRTEIVLNTALIDELAGTTEACGPPHLELTTRVESPSVAALNSGRFNLAIVGVFRAAGTTTGRFLDLVDPADRHRMIETYRTLPTHYANAVRVQLTCPPLYRDTENVTRHPRVLPDLLPIDEHHPAAEKLLDLDDLLVVGDTHGLALWSKTRDQPVEPHLFNAVSLTTRAHPLLRFLCEITTARTATPGPFSWGLAEHLPFLPRVRYHRATLTPARWTLTTDDVPAQDWDTALKQWRETWMVPDAVYLGTGDQRLALDLTEPAHRHLLRRHLRRHRRAILCEAPPADAFGWLDGRAHEITIPLAATRPPTPPPIRTRPRTVCTHDTAVAHLPGASPWLTCVLVSHPDRHTDLLAVHLPMLLNQLPAPRPSWWYVPYRDPDHHLRLRLHLPDPDSRGVALTRIGRWAEHLRCVGMISMLRFDTYWPELGRYGGPTAIADAEAVFTADSAVALTQRVQAATLDLTPITAASLLDIAIGLAGDTTSGSRWLLDHTPTPRVQASPDRALYTAALVLADPHTGRAAITTLPGGARILSSWDQRRTALARYRDTLLTEQNLSPQAVLASLVHMHSVRTHGIGTEHEPACLHLARAAARAHLARQKRL